MLENSDDSIINNIIAKTREDGDTSRSSSTNGRDHPQRSIIASHSQPLAINDGRWKTINGKDGVALSLTRSIIDSTSNIN